MKKKSEKLLSVLILVAYVAFFVKGLIPSFNHYAFIAHLFFKKGDVHSARKYAEKELKINPNEKWSHIFLVKYYLKYGDRESAKYHVKEILRADPADKNALKILIMLKKHDKKK